MKKIIILIVAFISLKVQAQCPEYFYSFVLKDADGKIIVIPDSNYKTKPIKYDSLSMVVLYEQCGDSENTNKLEIQKKHNDSMSETMIIEFPFTQYRKVYAGEINFTVGTYKIKLPKTDKEWIDLKRIKLCSDPNDEYGIFDISEFQKQD